MCGIDSDSSQWRGGALAVMTPPPTDASVSSSPMNTQAFECRLIFHTPNDPGSPYATHARLVQLSSHHDAPLMDVVVLI